MLSEKFLWQSVKLTLLEKNINAEGVESLKEVDSYKHTASVLKKITPDYTWGHLNLDECIRFCYNRKDCDDPICFTLYGICNSREYLFNYDFMLDCSDGGNWDEEDDEDLEKRFELNSFEDLDGFEGCGRTLVTNRSQQSRFYRALGNCILKVPLDRITSNGVELRFAGFSNPDEVTEDKPIKSWYLVDEPLADGFYDTSSLDPKEYKI